MDTTTKTPTTTTGAGTSVSPVNADTFLQTLQEKLINQSTAVSSLDSNLEATINNAIGGVSKAGEATASRIESSFGREIDYARTDQANAITQRQEGGRGYGVNVAALRQVVDSTDKNIKDLQTRKEEALLANDSATASKLADLQVKAFEFKQKATQDAFTNLLSLGNFALNTRQQQEQTRQFELTRSTQEKQAISNIALQFGIPVREGDTIDSITTRAAPYASQKQQLELAKLRAEINNSNAQATKALRGDSVNLDAATIKLIAETSLVNPAVIGNIKDAATLAQITRAQSEISKQKYTGAGLDTITNEYLQAGASIDGLTTQIDDNPYITLDQKATAKKRIIDLQTEKKKTDAINRAKSNPYVSPTGFFGNPAING